MAKFFQDKAERGDQLGPGNRQDEDAENQRQVLFREMPNEEVTDGCP